MLHVFEVETKRPCSFVLLTDIDRNIGHTDVIRWSDTEPRQVELERFLRTKAAALCIDSYNVEVDGVFTATTEF